MVRYVSENEKRGRAIRTRMTKDSAEWKQGVRLDGQCECDNFGGLHLTEPWS